MLSLIFFGATITVFHSLSSKHKIFKDDNICGINPFTEIEILLIW